MISETSADDSEVQWKIGDIGVERDQRATNAFVFIVRAVTEETLFISYDSEFTSEEDAGDGYSIETKEVNKNEVRKLRGGQ